MFDKSSAVNFTQVLEGIIVKTPAHGEKTLFAEFHMEMGSRLPMRAHPQERTGRLIRDRIVLAIESEKKEMAPGDCWNVPGNVERGAEIVEDSMAIEVFPRSGRITCNISIRSPAVGLVAPVVESPQRIAGVHHPGRL
ncbi:MAG: hypothetical protein JW929_13920 [Anaerolineales bacterium]|nr:hypothetical protein [Anaerolineales bacterium]